MSNTNRICMVFGAITGLFLLTTQVAEARPSGYSSDVCDPSGTDICFRVGVNWICDLGVVDDGSSGSSIHVIYDGSGTICETSSSTPDFCAWGVDGNGDSFYCEITYGLLSAVRVVGTDPSSGTAGDDIYLQYDEGSSYDLDDYGAPAGMTGVVSAGDGDDLIVGSRSTTSTYKDDLSGDDGEDEIEGHAGEDRISGGAHADTISGGADHDVIDGDGGDDIIKGDGGDDTINGDGGEDHISGGTEADTIYGGTGDDDLCGDAGDDWLDGQAGDDKLWGDTAYDWKDGGIHNAGDSCDAAGTNTRCEFVQANRPLGCP